LTIVSGRRWARHKLPNSIRRKLIATQTNIISPSPFILSPLRERNEVRGYL
jgi:hypothetical protein